MRGFKCRLQMTEKIISEPKDRSIEFTDMNIKEKTDWTNEEAQIPVGQQQKSWHLCHWCHKRRGERGDEWLKEILHAKKESEIEGV